MNSEETEVRDLFLSKKTTNALIGHFNRILPEHFNFDANRIKVKHVLLMTEQELMQVYNFGKSSFKELTDVFKYYEIPLPKEN